MTKLVMATEGPCAGHLCDNCRICQRGRCCRKDNPDYRLPKLGEWDGPIFGELGVLATDGERVECHFCGEWFKNVAVHAWWQHDVTADEYRAIVGMNRSTALVGPGVSARLADHAASLLRTNRLSENFRKLIEARNKLTPEQVSTWRGGGKRIEGRRSLAERGDHTGSEVRTCKRCGEKFVTYVESKRVHCANPECLAKYGVGDLHLRKSPWVAKLNITQAREIRTKFATGKFTIRALAREYGVTYPSIKHVIDHRTFREDVYGVDD